MKLKNIFLLILGNFSLALGTFLFIFPHNIVNGGTSGIALILENLFNFDPTLVVTILVWSLFFIGLFTLGKKFALKTLLSTFLYPLFLNIFNYLPYFERLSNEVSNPLLAIFAAAFLTGFGIGVAYRVGASTGGLDVISLLLKKYFNIKLSFSTLVIDSIIILFALFSLSLESALYGLLCVIVTSYIIEKITISGSSSYMAHIISEKVYEINDYLNNELERGTTLIEVKGGLTKQDKIMIEVVFNEKEYYDIKQRIHLIDDKAFISIYKSINTYGEGFEKIFVRRK